VNVCVQRREATRGLRLTVGNMSSGLLLLLAMVSGRGLYPVKRMTTGRTDYCWVQMTDKQQIADRRRLRRSVRYWLGAKTVCGQGQGFGGRVALMEDGIAFPTHARLTAACSGQVARLPFGTKLAPNSSHYT
jgi:hypothetical protein